MPYYRPRCAALLTVPTAGTLAERRDMEKREGNFEFLLNVSKANVTYNDHNAADELEIEASWDQAGVDPRFLQSAVVKFYVYDASRLTNPLAEEHLRFVGIATDIERMLEADGKTVKLKFLDYTSLFLRSMPFPAKGIPDFTQTLAEAWARICDFTGYFDPKEKRVLSSVEHLKDRLVFQGTAYPDVTLGSAVAQRIAKTGKLNPGLNKSSWDVWQHAVGSVGLISYIYLDKVIVTDAANYYTSKRAPTFVWGINIAKLTEKRDAGRANKGVALVSVDPLTGGAIEAFWPPRDHSEFDVKERAVTKSKKPKANGGLESANDYEFHQYPYGVTDPRMLESCARRVYEERSRQELTGHLITHEMRVIATETSGANDPHVQSYDDAHPPGASALFDVLSLGSGDLIKIRMEDDHFGAMPRGLSLSSSIAWLVDRGYTKSVAALLAINLREFGEIPAEFMVRSLHCEMDFDGDEGTFQIDIEFCNRITESAANNPT